MEATMAAPVILTSGAIKELRRIMGEPDHDADSFLRIGVKGGGCSGLSYVLGFDKKEEDDVEYMIEDIPVVMKKAHSLYLIGMNVDFKEGLDNRGFSFENPNASSSCGCGTSFAV